MNEMMKVEDVARFLRVKPEIVRRKVRSGHIKAYKIGKEWRFTEEDIKNFLNNCLL